MNIGVEEFQDLFLLIINKNNKSMRDLTNELIDYYLDQHINITGSDEKNIERFYVKFILDIISAELNLKDDRKDIKMLFEKYKTNDILNDRVMNSINYILNNENPTNVELISHVKLKIENLATWFRCNKNIRDMFGLVNNMKIQNISQTKEYFDNVIGLSRNIEKSIRDVNKDNQKHTEHIVSTDRESIKIAFQKYRENNMSGVIYTGLKGINRACGKYQGIAQGSSNVFAALSHNYKSEMLLSVAKWLKEYNNFKIKDGKTPVVLYISLENEANQNLMLWYQRIYGSITGKVDFDDKTEEEIIDDLYNYFKESNTVFVINRYLPSEFGVDSLKELIEDFEDSGHYVVSVIIDYLSQMKKPKADTKHDQIQQLYNWVRNYLGSKSITLWTAHQLNRGAAGIASNNNNSVKYFNENYLADCVDVIREVDNLWFLHIEKNHLEETFLTGNLYKKRYSPDARSKHSYFAYKFSSIGIIDDFINTKCQSVNNIYAENDAPQSTIF